MASACRTCKDCVFLPPRRGSTSCIRSADSPGRPCWSSSVIRCYFILRKRLATDNLGGLWVDMTLMLPMAFWFVQRR